MFTVSDQNRYVTLNKQVRHIAGNYKESDRKGHLHEKTSKKVTNKGEVNRVSVLLFTVCRTVSTTPPWQSTCLERFALALHEGHGVIPSWYALLSFHLDLWLGGELQLDGTGVHFGCTQQLLHPLHLLALKDNNGTSRGGGHLLLGRGRGIWAWRLGFSFDVSCTQALGGAPAACSLSHLLGLRCCYWRQGGRRGGVSWRRRVLFFQLWLSPWASPAALPGVITRLVIIVLGLRIFSDDRHLLAHLWNQTTNRFLATSTIMRSPADTVCIDFWTVLVCLSHLSIKAAQGLNQVGGPAHMQDWCGTALFPFADTIIKAQQVGKAFWILECWESCCLFGLLLGKKERQKERKLEMSWESSCENQ